MAKSKYISKYKRRELTAVTNERDYGNSRYEPFCMICGDPFIENDPDYKSEFGHLDERKIVKIDKVWCKDNSSWNIVKMHRRCNLLMYQKPTAFLNKAKKLIKKNQEYEKQCIEVYDEKQTNDFVRQQLSDSDISKVTHTKSKRYNSIAIAYLSSNLIDYNSWIFYDEAITAIGGICMKNWEFGDPESIKRHLKILTSKEYGKWCLELNPDGDQIIKRINSNNSI